MNLQELYAKIEEKRRAGKEALKAENLELAETLKAEIKETEKELKAELMFLKDENAQKLANEVDKFHASFATPNENDEKNPFASAKYLDAVLDDLMGIANAETKAYIAEVNSHTTQTTSTVIPDRLIGAIWTAIEEQYPLFASVPRTNIPSPISYDRNEGHSNVNVWVGSESVPTPAVTFNFGKFILNGHEASLHVPISFKLEVMSRSDFQAHLVAQMSLLFGKALSQAIYDGTGIGQPTGIKTALTLIAPDRMINQATVTYQTITNVLSKLKSRHKRGLVIYANNSTIWTVLANIVDGLNRPMFIPLVTQSGVGQLFGIRVVEAAEIPDGEIMFANLHHAYRLNVLENIRLSNERDNMNRVVKHFLYAILDGNLLDPTAVVILTTPSITTTKAKKETAKE